MTKGGQKIFFHSVGITPSLRNRRILKEILLRLFRREGRAVSEVHYIFCDDQYLVALNQTYLRHNTLTDIITFDYEEQRCPARADIYISVERVRENANSFSTFFSTELRRVIFHGALHLCGYRDKTSEEAAVMRKKEDEYLQLFGSTWNKRPKD